MLIPVHLLKEPRFIVLQHKFILRVVFGTKTYSLVNLWERGRLPLPSGAKYSMSKILSLARRPSNHTMILYFFLHKKRWADLIRSLLPNLWAVARTAENRPRSILSA